MNWLLVVLIFFSLMVLRLVINAYKLRRIKKLYQLYHNYIRNANWDFVQCKQEIVSLFKEAGLKDSSVLHQEFLGYGRFANMQMSVFSNITILREDIVGIVQISFNEAIGVYKKRRNDSLNPIFWLEFIFKMPQYLLEFFGVLPEKIAVKVILVIYWIAALVFGLAKYDILSRLLK